MPITKNVLLNWYCLTKKKPERVSNDFWHRKLTLKVKLWLFFDTSPLHQFSKSNIFLWVCWFLGKNCFDFVSPDSKLHNQYYKKYILPAPGATGPSVITMIITFKLFAANIFLNFSLPYCKMPLRGISMPSYPKSANAGIAVSRLLWGDFKKTNK